jgi:hypothetical protein|tara:strand:- start:375 stop:617 length:243 start_codon:yes stop_codon:yes gene_type:complete
MILKENKMKNETGRGWHPNTDLQEVLFNTYKTKSIIGQALELSQPTLKILLADEKKITFKQLLKVSKDSKISLIKLIKLL